MKAYRYIVVALGTSVLLSMSNVNTAQSQSSPEAMLANARTQLDDSFYSEGIQELAEVSRLHPGTADDLQARMELAYQKAAAGRDYPKAKEIYASVIRDFPGEFESMVARINLADIHYLDESGSFAEYIAELDGIARTLNASSVSVVATTGIGTYQPTVGLNPDIQRACLHELYWVASCRFSRASTSPVQT